jgi:hypothetical protein
MPLEQTLTASFLVILILFVVWACYENWRIWDDERKNGPASEDKWQGKPSQWGDS